MNPRIITVPGGALPATLRPNSRQRLDDDEYFNFCIANPSLRIERTAQGEFIISPPEVFETDHQIADVVAQLAAEVAGGRD